MNSMPEFWKKSDWDRMGIKGERCGMKVYQYGLRLCEVDVVEMSH